MALLISPSCPPTPSTSPALLSCSLPPSATAAHHAVAFGLSFLNLDRSSTCSIKSPQQTFYYTSNPTTPHTNASSSGRRPSRASRASRRHSTPATPSFDFSSITTPRGVLNGIKLFEETFQSIARRSITTERILPPLKLVTQPHHDLPRLPASARPECPTFFDDSTSPTSSPADSKPWITKVKSPDMPRSFQVPGARERNKAAAAAKAPVRSASSSRLPYTPSHPVPVPPLPVEPTFPTPAGINTGIDHTSPFPPFPTAATGRSSNDTTGTSYRATGPAPIQTGSNLRGQHYPQYEVVIESHTSKRSSSTPPILHRWARSYSNQSQQIYHHNLTNNHQPQYQLQPQLQQYQQQQQYHQQQRTSEGQDRGRTPGVPGTVRSSKESAVRPRLPLRQQLSSSHSNSSFTPSTSSGWTGANSGTQQSQSSVSHSHGGGMGSMSMKKQRSTELTREEFEALPLAVRRKYFSTLERLRFAAQEPLDDPSSTTNNDSPSTSFEAIRKTSHRHSRLISDSLTDRLIKRTSLNHGHGSRSGTPPSSSYTQDPEFYATLPDKIKKRGDFTREEQLALARQLRESVILDAADEAVYKIGKRASRHIVLGDITLTKDPSTTPAPEDDTPPLLATATPRGSLDTTDSERRIPDPLVLLPNITEDLDAVMTMTASTPTMATMEAKAGSDIPAAFLDSFRWLDEDEDLDLKLFLDDYHNNLRDTLPEPKYPHPHDPQQADHKTRRSSFRRHLSITKIPFSSGLGSPNGRSSTSSNRPSTGMDCAFSPNSATFSPTSPKPSPLGNGFPQKSPRRSRTLSLINHHGGLARSEVTSPIDDNGRSSGGSVRSGGTSTLGGAESRGVGGSGTRGGAQSGRRGSRSSPSKNLPSPTETAMDPDAKHYQDPEARLKLRVYLGSPQKFDEAVEFGFPTPSKDAGRPSAEVRVGKRGERGGSKVASPLVGSAPPPMSTSVNSSPREQQISRYPSHESPVQHSQQPRQPPQKSIKARNNTAAAAVSGRSRAVSNANPKMRTFLSDDFVDNDSDNENDPTDGEESVDPESPLTPRTPPVVPKKEGRYQSHRQDRFPAGGVSTTTITSGSPPPNPLTAAAVASRAVEADVDSLGRHPTSPVVLPSSHHHPYVQQQQVQQGQPEQQGKYMQQQGQHGAGYAQAPASSREMTLRMTLTRPDLRACEEQIYGWQEKRSPGQTGDGSWGVGKKSVNVRPTIGHTGLGSSTGIGSESVGTAGSGSVGSVSPKVAYLGVGPGSAGQPKPSMEQVFRQLDDERDSGVGERGQFGGMAAGGSGRVKRFWDKVRNH